MILPAFLRRKLATLGQAPVIKKRIKLKIITGVGHTVMREGSGNLREHVEKYLNQKGLRYVEGLFEVHFGFSNYVFLLVDSSTTVRAPST